MIELSDSDLVKKCLEGHAQAFATLIERYQKTLFNIVYRLTNNYDDTEDVVQSAFIKAYNNLSFYKSKYKFYSWIYRIAVNESINLIKKKKQTELLEPEIIKDRDTPENLYQKKELKDQIQNVLMKLDSKYRVLIVLCQLENCSYQEVSQVLKIDEKKVKSRLFTARQKLKELLVNEGIVK